MGGRGLAMLLLCLMALACMVAGAPPQLFTPKIDERTLVADHWQLKPKWIYKRDQSRPPIEDLALLPDRTALIGGGALRGFWRVEASKVTGAQTLVVDVPRGSKGDAFVTYEIPVAPGKMYPGSVRFEGEGAIFYESSKQPRRRIGACGVDIRRKYKNLLDLSYSR
eukprot:TRINITY_DN27004_c0_g1_i1.p3 TRINITY_DN27004_c0_g1~~TRINITY_DN27004_c0_g1_i1.p3  ORF type:complete len:166 (-),score=47.56 TRINITY_DN27004_c0_g1_i1:39-536(-)